MKILITAGPTREAIDAVRFISNRSSGAMGAALAKAAVDAGHQVTLLLGPVGAELDLPKPSATYCVHRFESAADLEGLLGTHFAECDVLIMAAAVTDYRPGQTSPIKLPRKEHEPLVLQFDPTPDLVSQVAKIKRADQRIIAFALEEEEQLEGRAMQKLKRKQVDAIVANPLKTMESDRVAAVWLTADPRSRCAPDQMSKSAFATWLLDRITAL